MYHTGLLKIEHLPVPVVVVGNITVGGVGKTPLVIYLAQRLTTLGWRTGIISRGYGSKRVGGALDATAIVTPASSPEQVGDEPVLLAQRTACPVVIGADRVAAAKRLLTEYPDVQVIVSDDGLQHYRLGRFVEIAVTAQGSDLNAWPLPAGPMREAVSRLNTVDAVVRVRNSADTAVLPAPTLDSPVAPIFEMTTTAGDFYALADRSLTVTASAFATKRIHAVAGIGNPDRFFQQLRTLGIMAEEHAFPDHHAYHAPELAFPGDVILTTEKDAVKLQHLELAIPVWVLPLEITVEPDLACFVMEKLNGRTPA